MPRLRFSVSTLILGVVIASLIFALIYQISINSKLREDNQSLRKELGFPEGILTDGFYAARAYSVPITEELDWAWTVFVPEGTAYRLLVQTKDIPTANSGGLFPEKGTEVLRMGQGARIIRVSINSNGFDSTLVVACGRDRTELKFDGSFMTTRPGASELLDTPWGTPPRRLELYRAHTEDPKKIHDIDGIPHAEDGLQIWLERVEDKQDSSPE